MGLLNGFAGILAMLFSHPDSPLQGLIENPAEAMNAGRALGVNTRLIQRVRNVVGKSQKQRKLSRAERKRREAQRLRNKQRARHTGRQRSGGPLQ